MFRIETKNAPRSKHVREMPYGLGAVRVYQHSPEDIALQLWCPNGRYTLVALFPEEARAIGEQLIALADEHLTPLEPGELQKIITKG